MKTEKCPHCQTELVSEERSDGYPHILYETAVPEGHTRGFAHEDARCVEVLVENIARLEKERVERLTTRVLLKLEAAIKEELDRGYVLTHEPGAGELWRARWNSMLQQIEEVLPKKPEPLPTGCLGCNHDAVKKVLVERGMDLTRLTEVPEPRHNWGDVSRCASCGRCWLVAPPPRPCATCGKPNHRPQDHAGWDPTKEGHG